jgi:hypothetical protein
MTGIPPKGITGFPIAIINLLSGRASILTLLNISIRVRVSTNAATRETPEPKKYIEPGMGRLSMFI